MRVRYRLATLLRAVLASSLLIPLSVGWALANDPHRLDAAQVGAAVLGHLVAVLTGTAVAAVVSRPLVERTGHAFVLAVVFLVVLVAVPHLPPVRSVVEMLDARQPDLSSVGRTTAATLTVAVLAAWASAVLGRRRQ